MYFVIGIIGAAGAGKDSLLQAIMRLPNDSLNEIISCTTRPPREGEVDGVNYNFITKNEFLKKDFIEFTEFRGWYYGTPYDALAEGKCNIGVFNPAGADLLMKDPNVWLLPIWVRANDKTRLSRQLNREPNPDVNEIIRRYATDTEDFAIDWSWKNSPWLITVDNDENKNLCDLATEVYGKAYTNYEVFLDGLR